MVLQCSKTCFITQKMYKYMVLECPLSLFIVKLTTFYLGVIQKQVHISTHLGQLFLLQ